MNEKYLKRKISEYLNRLTDIDMSEWYMTPRDLAASQLNDFYNWLLLEPDFYANPLK